MSESSNKVTTNVARLASPSKEGEDEEISKQTSSKSGIPCASGIYCSTPNEPIPQAHTCTKCKKKIHIWCRGSGLDTEISSDHDFSEEYCILCSGGKCHPENASFNKGPNIETPTCQSIVDISHSKSIVEEEFQSSDYDEQEGTDIESIESDIEILQEDSDDDHIDKE